jgi:hypothetical protein
MLEQALGADLFMRLLLLEEIVPPGAFVNRGKIFLQVHPVAKGKAVLPAVLFETEADPPEPDDKDG